MLTISRLVIDQQFGTIGIKITPAHLQISTPDIRRMQIKNDPTQLKIESKTPEMNINWSRVENQTNRKSYTALNRDWVDGSRNTALRAISEAVSDGDNLGRIEQPGNRVSSYIKQKSINDTGEKELNISSREMPEIKWDKGYVNINWTEHNFKIEWDSDFMPEVNVDPRHSVEIFLRNQPRITITVEESEYNDIGLLFDMKL